MEKTAVSDDNESMETTTKGTSMYSPNCDCADCALIRKLNPTARGFTHSPEYFAGRAEQDAREDSDLNDPDLFDPFTDHAAGYRPGEEIPRMTVTISALGVTLATLNVRGFDDFGSAPDHFAIIAPAYLSPLSNGAPFVLVTFSGVDADGEEFHFCEKHTAIGWRDGRVVGTAVEIVSA